MKINSEAILNRLIHDGYIKIINREDREFWFDEYEDDSMFIEDFWSEINKSSCEGNAIALVIQRALFHECVKRGCEIKIKFFASARPEGTLLVESVDSLIFSGDTSRESFILAYQKVVGI